MNEKYGRTTYSRYGFVDAFNPQTGWTDTDVIGINAGIILLSAENMRSGNVWRWFMRNVEIPRALDRIGLVSRVQPRRAGSKQTKEVNQHANVWKWKDLLPRDSGDGRRAFD
jgi:hypothetical protein